jgi:hypothetical protein
MAALATVHGITRETVSVVLKRNGVPIRQLRRLDGRGLKRAIRLYEQGWSTERVGADLGFDAKTIANQLKAAGVQVRDAHERPPGQRTRRPASARFLMCVNKGFAKAQSGPSRFGLQFGLPEDSGSPSGAS